MLAAISQAAPFSYSFNNNFQIDSIYLFIAEGDVTFEKWQQVPQKWEVGYDQPDMISISGPMIDPGKPFRVKFSDRGTFTLKWAELLNGAIQGSGSWFAVNGSFVGAGNNFTSQIPTPTTSTFWLFGPGLICMLYIRWRLGN